MKVVYNKSPRAMPKPQAGLINPLIENRFDQCPFCKAQRIEVFSFNGYPQNYKEAVDDYLRGYNVSYDQYELRTMKCRACGKEFTIDWSSGFPKPLRDSHRVGSFIAEFMMGI